MNRVHRARRWAAILAGLAGALLTCTTPAPAAMAMQWPPPGGGTAPPDTPSRIHAIVSSGMPGWQVTLIAIAPAILAAG